MTEITVDPGSHIPPYEQIREQFTDLISSATLPPGHRLPPIRQLASDLGLAPGTVARAYQELESAGYVQTRRAAGTVVAKDAPRTTDRVESIARQYVQTSQRLGLSLDQAVMAVKENWGAA